MKEVLLLKEALILPVESLLSKLTIERSEAEIKLIKQAAHNFSPS